jgi:hypothetical protein
MVRVFITPGNAVTNLGDGEWHVAKRQLVSVLAALMGESRLRVRAKDDLAPVLQREMRTFTVRTTAAGNEKFEADWREKEHDNLVLALALACWAAESLTWPPAPDEGTQVLTA